MLDNFENIIFIFFKFLKIYTETSKYKSFFYNYTKFRLIYQYILIKKILVY